MKTATRVQNGREPKIHRFFDLKKSLTCAVITIGYLKGSFKILYTRWTNIFWDLHLQVCAVSRKVECWFISSATILFKFNRNIPFLSRSFLQEKKKNNLKSSSSEVVIQTGIWSLLANFIFFHNNYSYVHPSLQYILTFILDLYGNNLKSNFFFFSFYKVAHQVSRIIVPFKFRWLRKKKGKIFASLSAKKKKIFIQNEKITVMRNVFSQPA